MIRCHLKPKREFSLYKKNCAPYIGRMNTMEVEVAKIGRGQTEPWTVVLPIETARQIVKIYDGWARIVSRKFGDDYTPQNIDKLRAKISEGDGSTWVAVALPLQLKERLEHAISRSARNRNFVMRRCIVAGVRNVTAKILAERLEGKKPSISLIALIAIERELPNFEKDFNVPAFRRNGAQETNLGRPVEPKKEVKYWPIALTREHANWVVEKLFEIRDAWARQLGDSSRDRQEMRLREALKPDKTASVLLSMFATPETRRRAIELAETREFSTNHVCNRALIDGLKNLTAKKVRDACDPDQSPSVSQVAGVAMIVGLSAFEKKHPLTLKSESD